VGNPSSISETPIVIVDPVNVDNNVAAKIEEAERIAVVVGATDAWEGLMDVSFGARPKGETVDRWREYFGPSFRIED